MSPNDLIAFALGGAAGILLRGICAFLDQYVPGTSRWVGFFMVLACAGVIWRSW